MKIRVYILALFMLVAPFHSLAAMPDTISYQGRVTDSGGTPLQGSQSIPSPSIPPYQAAQQPYGVDYEYIK